MPPTPSISDNNPAASGGLSHSKGEAYPMDFIEQLQQLAKRIPQLCEHLQTEEATNTNFMKQAFIKRGRS